MPPISPIKDENTGKTVKSATLTPFKTMSIDEVHRLITSDQRLTELTLPAAYSPDDGATASRNPPSWL